MKFSFFNSVFGTVPDSVITLNDYLNGVKSGKWKNVVEKVRATNDKKKRTELKTKLAPAVIIAGIFERRNIAGISEASGFINIDFDDVIDIENAEELLRKDPYITALHRSISNTGLSAIVPIDPKKFTESFLGLEKYFIDNYGLPCDTKCKDISRARFISYDPNTFANLEAAKFDRYLPKETRKPNPAKFEVLHSESDFERLVDEVTRKGIDLTQSSYERFLSIAFALINEYGDSGTALNYFHILAQNSAKYDSSRAEKQFYQCARSERKGLHNDSAITISTIFHYAKEFGIQPISNETRKAGLIAKQGKKQGIPEAEIKARLVVAGVAETDAEKILDFVKKDTNSVDDGTSLIAQLEVFLQSNYNLRRNEITRSIENGKEVLETKDLNTVYIQAKKAVDDKVNYQDVERLINSDFTDSYNPIYNFFDTHRSRNETGLIDALADCLETPDPEFTRYYVKKWFVSIISSAYYKYSPLVLVLTGGMNSGKTEYFRRLLPENLSTFYAESKLDAGKDDEILMCQKLLIVDDEFGGKSKRDMTKFKDLTSKQIFSLREPYGRKNIDMKRLALLAGTSNEDELLSDPTGNRRILPIKVLSINHEKYNAIDKISLLMEAFHLFEKGFNVALDKADIERLNNATTEFESTVVENDLLNIAFRPAKEQELGSTLLTATEILIELQRIGGPGIRLGLKMLGMQLKKHGFTLVAVKVRGSVLRKYHVIRLTASQSNDTGTGHSVAPLPSSQQHTGPKKPTDEF